MGQKYGELPLSLIEFIEKQKIFFVATSAPNSRLNLSPKGMDSFKVINGKRVVWLNATGSGNETSAHVQVDPRMTIMFCAFEGEPLILRLYGTAKVVHMNDAEWTSLYAHFDPLPGARQIFDVSIDLVQSSCGMSIPFYEYKNERTELSDWAEQKGELGIQAYWEKKNQLSIDGLPTHVVEKNFMKKSSHPQ